ncbi:Retrovirus-related Pol polyprotein from type-1 retrotransposable element R1 [Eumeta japonica]|uniref:Retrovirus-related Pol polyprotein from type-1 retrotransposable element R1 n=1 Tax=Eumeta variegata TaxID=151549 RepID=A0A4C1Y6J4_EUMVA|nr:Retrovirus-related Pol polyprotein from type-1 retrotransposable element R1 [Eumeta japonica]
MAFLMGPSLLPRQVPSNSRVVSILLSAYGDASGRSSPQPRETTLDIRNAFNSVNWDCIMRALEEKSIPKYLCREVASYFTNRVLKYDTEKSPKEYKITGGVLQETKLVAYADDVAVIIVEKHLDEINLAFEKAFERINQWMETMNLQLAKQKTEAVLISRRKKVETIKSQVGEQEIMSLPYIRYLGVMIDVRLNFKQQVEHVSTKASAVKTSLARLMPSVGGPMQRKYYCCHEWSFY